MKNTFKLLFIFMGGLTAIIIITIAGFILIEQNKTFYIYDIRFVVPVEEESGYIYTYVPTGEEKGVTPANDYERIRNTTVYMYSESENLFPIAVYASTSNDTKDIKITSSDTSVAKIVFIDGLCYVKYMKEGIATITSEVGGVTDSFILKVLDMVPSNFQVFDLAYYGEEYVDLFPNSIVGYADGMEYRYSYKLSDITGSDDISKIDGDLIRIDETNLDTNVFSNVVIDSANHELVVTCKVPESAQTENINTSIVLQSFTYGKDGEKIVQDNYIVSVYVVLEIPEFLQIEVSKSPDFEEGYVFTNTQKDENFSYTNEEILANPSLLEDYLSAEKAEKYLAEREEKATYNVYFTEKVNKLYIRFRMVYTNGKVEYLTNGDNATFKFNGLDSDKYCTLAPMDNYYILRLSTDGYYDYYVEDLGEYNDYGVTVKLNNFIFDQFTFNFEYIEESTDEETIEKLYKKDETTGIYTYKYWDERARFTNEVCDKDGNIIGFGA